MATVLTRKHPASTPTVLIPSFHKAAPAVTERDDLGYTDAEWESFRAKARADIAVGQSLRFSEAREKELHENPAYTREEYAAILARGLEEMKDGQKGEVMTKEKLRKLSGL